MFEVVLIILFSAGTASGGVSVDHISFATMELCLEAEKGVESISHDIRPRPKAICVPTKPDPTEQLKQMLDGIKDAVE